MTAWKNKLQSLVRKKIHFFIEFFLLKKLNMQICISIGLRKTYTDDTALTLAVGRTLEACKQIGNFLFTMNDSKF